MKIITKTVWQMSATGMTKVLEESHEYSGKVAHCGGRPVLTPDYLSTHRVGVPGTKGRNFMSGRSTQSGTCIRRTRLTGPLTR